MTWLYAVIAFNVVGIVCAFYTCREAEKVIAQAYKAIECAKEAVRLAELRELDDDRSTKH